MAFKSYALTILVKTMLPLYVYTYALYRQCTCTLKASSFCCLWKRRSVEVAPAILFPVVWSELVDNGLKRCLDTG